MIIDIQILYYRIYIFFYIFCQWIDLIMIIKKNIYIYKFINKIYKYMTYIKWCKYVNTVYIMYKILNEICISIFKKYELFLTSFTLMILIIGNLLV